MPAMIVLGDKTDHGGEVIEASGVTDTHGKRIARVGDKVSCPKKGHGTTEIVTGDLTMVIDGKAVAYHGCKTSCGATLISSQMVSSVEFGGCAGSSVASPAPASTPAPLAAASTTSLAATADQKQPFDLRFLLKDDKTGAPLFGMPYKITLDNGEEFTGSTDVNGLTLTVGSDRQRIAYLDAPYYGHVSSSSHTHDEHCACSR
ncbi:MAG: PAAR domain-containing protein [Rhizobacter sp.]|nr:PAAR domain-containing protein [Rhizobacter sp.]